MNNMALLLSNSKIQAFTDPLMWAKYICNNPVDRAILKCDMRLADGVTLLKVIKAHTPSLSVLLVSRETAQSELQDSKKDVRCICGPLTADKIHRLKF